MSQCNGVIAGRNLLYSPVSMYAFGPLLWEEYTNHAGGKGTLGDPAATAYC